MKTTGNHLLCHFYSLLVYIALCHGKDLFFNDNENLQLPESYTIDWMRALRDDKVLSDITIPGTHDTMALHGGPAAECQAWHLSNQLRAGIRYLDLRLFALDHQLYAMHGPIYQYTTFSTVLDTIRAFLSEFPSETVLVSVQPDLFDKDDVEAMVKSTISNDQNVWVRSEIPTLGEVRGKMVFVQKSNFKLGVAFMETDTKDDYEVTHVSDKEALIVDHLTQATKDCGGDHVVLTYSSGTGIGTFLGMFLTPKKIAEQIDPWLDRYLREFYNDHPRPCFGIIAMDFPGIDLIQTVIEFNAQ